MCLASAWDDITCGNGFSDGNKINIEPFEMACLRWFQRNVYFAEIIKLMNSGCVLKELMNYWWMVSAKTGGVLLLCFNLTTK